MYDKECFGRENPQSYNNYISVSVHVIPEWW